MKSYIYFFYLSQIRKDINVKIISAVTTIRQTIHSSCLAFNLKNKYHKPDIAVDQYVLFFLQMNRGFKSYRITKRDKL